MQLGWLIDMARLRVLGLLKLNTTETEKTGNLFGLFSENGRLFPVFTENEKKKSLKRTFS